MANVGGDFANSDTHDGYSDRGLATGVVSLEGSLEGGRIVERPGMGVPGFNAQGMGVLE